ncbi:MAG: prepilin-type N-terminal cleavage/methylation domain-containing protein [Ilumatobacter sp.]|jgi:prepilin-type N-terminal cleavage/methylation domain-containing protein
MNNNQDKGFTLVELLIVIVILGILATVTVFAVQGITEKGQDNACNVEQRALETAVEAYYVDQTVQAYPGTLAALTPKFTKTAADEAGEGNLTGTWTYTSATGSVEATVGGKCA